jgi:hypothetical protein
MTFLHRIPSIAIPSLQVYPYSVFHIFFEQYLNTHRDAALLVGLPLLAVFGAAWLFTGSLWGSSILLAMLVSLMLQLAGSMYLSGIEVNAGEFHHKFLLMRHGTSPAVFLNQASVALQRQCVGQQHSAGDARQPDASTGWINVPFWHSGIEVNAGELSGFLSLRPGLSPAELFFGCVEGLAICGEVLFCWQCWSA